MIVIIMIHLLPLSHILIVLLILLNSMLDLDIGQDRISRLAKESLLDSLTKVKLPKYVSCLAGKAIVKLFG